MLFSIQVGTSIRTNRYHPFDLLFLYFFSYYTGIVATHYYKHVGIVSYEYDRIIIIYDILTSLQVQ